MNDNLISIIIPVYNAEKYLHRCMYSILKQTYQNLEVILVNDGSTDSSGEICDQFKKEYPDKVIVLHQSNQGVSIARNNGIKVANGEYIGFVDSDDWIIEEMYEKMLTALLENKAQVVICDYYEVREECIVEKRVYSDSTKNLRLLLKQPAPAFSWNKLFHKSLVSYLEYPENITLGEDVVVINPLLSYIEDYVYLKEPLYYYYIRQDSATRSITDIKSMLSYLEAGKLAIERCNPTYRNEIIYTIACRIYSARNWALKYAIAESIEYVRENLYPYFKNNEYIMDDPSVNKILDYNKLDLIPAKIYYTNFENRKLEEHELLCIKTWKERTPDYEIVELNNTNCQIDYAPERIKRAYASGNYTVVADYYTVKTLYDKGGIFLDPRIMLNKPIGHLRCEKTFFGFEDDKHVAKKIMGTVAGTQLFNQLIDIYEKETIYINELPNLMDMITELLIYNYRLKPIGWTQLLDDGIKVYSADYFYYNLGDSNISQIYDKYVHEISQTKYQVIDKELLTFWIKDKDLLWFNDKDIINKIESIRQTQNRAKQPTISNQELINLKNELQMAKIEIQDLHNSTCWKITSPIRWLLNRIRGNAR